MCTSKSSRLRMNSRTGFKWTCKRRLEMRVKSRWENAYILEVLRIERVAPHVGGDRVAEDDQQHIVEPDALYAF